MNMYEYDYTLSPEADRDVYEKQKKHLLSIPDIKHEKELEDVDGSLIQIFYLGEKKIKLTCSEDVGAVYLESEVDISELTSIRTT